MAGALLVIAHSVHSDGRSVASDQCSPAANHQSPSDNHSSLPTRLRSTDAVEGGLHVVKELEYGSFNLVQIGLPFLQGRDARITPHTGWSSAMDGARVSLEEGDHGGQRVRGKRREVG